MPWDQIIEAVLRIISECQASKSDEQLADLIQRGGIRVRLACRRACVEAGLRGAELRRAVGQLMDDLEAASRPEVLGLLADARQAA